MIDISSKVVKHGINFFNQSVEDVRMFSEVVTKGGERVGGCLEAGNNENDSLEL